MKKNKVLFLCTGNSCRSQLAEAIVNYYLGDTWQAYSAGVKPVGYIHPLTLQVLEEIGIHHDGSSKSADIFRGTTFDLVVTVCDDANENCPIWLGKGKTTHISFPDPASMNGSQEDQIYHFRLVRDAIRKKITELLLTLNEF